MLVFLDDGNDRETLGFSGNGKVTQDIVSMLKFILMRLINYLFS